MMNEPEWRDANPSTENLPGKGRVAIICIVGGIAILVFAILGMRIRPLGLGVGALAFIFGIRMLIQRRQLNFKPGWITTVSGFLMLLANPRFGVVAGFAGYFLVVIAIGLMVFGLFKAIKLAWDVGRRS